MAHRTKEQWLTLFQAHEQSGMSASAFCKEHSLNPKYFSLRRKQLKQPEALDDNVPFVRVASSPKTVVSKLTLSGKYGELTIPDSVSPQWLASLMKQLS